MVGSHLTLLATKYNRSRVLLHIIKYCYFTSCQKTAFISLAPTTSEHITVHTLSGNTACNTINRTKTPPI